MPSPLTPEQTFGFGEIPLTSYFKAPKGGSRNTMFSPQARAMLQQDEALQQEQMQMEADQLVNDLLGQAPQLSDAQINQTLLQNPNIFRGRNAGLIQNYQQFRQQAATPADQKLGMYFYTKLQEDKDPRALQNFQRRMLDEGMSANDAWEAYRVDQFNEPLAQQLAEAGVPREEFDKYRTPTGTFDPVEVSRGIAQTRAAAKASSLGKKTAEPIDEEIELLKDAMEQRKKRLEATGGDLTKDTVFLDYADSLDKAYGQKRLVLRPPPKPVIGPANQPGPDGVIKRVAPGVARPPVDIESNSDLLPEEKVVLKNQAAQQKEKDRAQAIIDNEIASAWSKQKSDVQKDIEKQYSKKDLLAAAKGILRGALAPGATQLVEGEPAEDYLNYLLRKIGRKANDPAFTEPQNKRWGTQVVTNMELLQAWAEQYAAENGGQKAASAPTSDTSEPLTELIPP